MMDSKVHSHRLLFIAFLLIVFDQATKIAVKGFSILGFTHDGMFLGESISVIGEFLRFTFVENPGMAFGVEFGSGKIFLTLFSLIASIGLVYYLLKIESAKIQIRIAIMLILAGAFGNFIDRMFYGVLYGEGPLFYGLVVDFIQIDIPDIQLGQFAYTHWPVFNIADSCVSIGMILILSYNRYLPYPFTQVNEVTETTHNGN
jgi:signal peptidase II